MQELHQMRLMEIFRQAIAGYTALRGNLLKCSFDGFDASNSQVSRAYNATIRWVQGKMTTPWVYLYGPPGNGKTHLAAAAANYLLVRRRAVLFATAPELLTMIRGGYDTGQAETLIGLCQRAPWLVIDDLGTERLTEWAAEVMFRILDARYVSRTSTLVVSNASPDRIEEPRLSSRFLDCNLCLVVPNTGSDYRKRKERGK